ncbi:hypothetical protein Smar_0753 [Staphylothermus marinus F1]|uniref:Uncharacterized protein n=1 Tax=Staphylothermus marinus (strain ATCC 43588 / DSM 3639 / JCM 9404 / F1) TaxID=399550 RepID=A3DMJ4_STAMF|nr:hypothetical protein [Staphylothermus marinus]ABN69854.1 hypothetical protein Smar_0753 [Staphylothermus marinus F1]
MFETYVIIKISSNASKRLKNKLSKILRGTTVTIKGRRYRSRGLIQKYNGIILSPGTYLIPSNMLENLLNELEQRELREHIIVRKCICTCLNA